MGPGDAVRPKNTRQRQLQFAAGGVVSALAVIYVSRYAAAQLWGVVPDADRLGSELAPSLPSVWGLFAASLVAIGACAYLIAVVTYTLFSRLSSGRQSGLESPSTPSISVAATAAFLLAAVSLSGIMMILNVGMTLPIAVAPLPLRLDTLLYYIRLAAAPLALCIVAARSRMHRVSLLVSLAIVAVIASASSGSRLVALIYCLPLVFVSGGKRLLRLLVVLGTAVLAVNVATRVRSLLIPSVVDSQVLRDAYAQAPALAIARDVSPEAVVIDNFLRLSVDRLLSFSEMRMALSYDFGESSFATGIQSLLQYFGFRVDRPPNCGSINAVYGLPSDAFGGRNLDPIGGLWFGACGVPGVFAIGLVLSGALLGVSIALLFVLGDLLEAPSLGATYMVACFLLWYDTRFTVLRFLLVTVLIAIVAMELKRVRESRRSAIPRVGTASESTPQLR